MKHSQLLCYGHEEAPQHLDRDLAYCIGCGQKRLSHYLLRCPSACPQAA